MCHLDFFLKFQKSIILPPPRRPVPRLPDAPLRRRRCRGDAAPSSRLARMSAMIRAYRAQAGRAPPRHRPGGCAVSGSGRVASHGAAILFRQAGARVRACGARGPRKALKNALEPAGTAIPGRCRHAARAPM